MMVTNHMAQKVSSLVCNYVYLLHVLNVPDFVSKYCTMLQALFERHLGVCAKDHHPVKRRGTLLPEAFLQESCLFLDEK